MYGRASIGEGILERLLDVQGHWLRWRFVETVECSVGRMVERDLWSDSWLKIPSG